MHILAIDVGSSSVRALLFSTDDDGVARTPIATVQKQYQFDTDSNGQATISAVFLRELVESCVDDMLAQIGSRTIDAVGMDTFVGNFLLVNEQNEPIIALDTYADTRSADCVDQLAEKLDMSALHQRTGTLLNTAYYLPKLCFHSERQSDDSVTVLDFATYCYRHWFGRIVPMSYSIASWSGLLNRQTLDWDVESLETISWSTANFPELADFSHAEQGLSEPFAQRWQRLADVAFYLAVGDGAAAQVGSGAISDHRVALTIGTTAAIRTVKIEKTPTVPDGCWSYRIDSDHHLIGGALSEGGNIFAWANETLQLEGIDIEAGLAEREPASHDLTVLPLLNGERSPGWRADAVGTIHGLRLHTTPMDILHALLESVALRLALIADQLNLHESAPIMGAGGALIQSPAWAQMIASALGRELHVIDQDEVTAWGLASMIYGVLLGDNLSSAEPKIGKIYKPKTNYSVIFERSLAQQQALYRQTDRL